MPGVVRQEEEYLNIGEDRNPKEMVRKTSGGGQRVEAFDTLCFRATTIQAIKTMLSFVC